MPHSSACAERIFSLMNYDKTRNTNSLKAVTVKDTLPAKQSIARNVMECTLQEPGKELIKDLGESARSKEYLENFF